MSSVSFVKIEKENQKKKAILDSLILIDYKFTENIKNVVIKPNLCYYLDYSTGQTTDPKFVAAIIDIIHEQVSPNIGISIVESDASAMKCKYAFKMLGYEKLARKYGISLVNLSQDESGRVKVVTGGQSFRFMLPKKIQNADLRINVPKIKYMAKTEISCALKNIFGCNPYPQKFKYHQNLDETIVALNKVMKFDLCIVDGNIVSGIQPYKLGLVMASRDPVALDAAATKIMGLNAKSIRHIMLAHEEGIGNISFIPKGITLDHFKAMYPRKGVRSKIISKAYNLVLTMGLGQRLGLN